MILESIVRSCKRSLRLSTLPGLTKDDAALVTGGLKGLGLEIVKELLRRNSVGNIYVLDVLDIPSSLKDTVSFVKCDLSSPESLHKAIDQVYSKLGNSRLSVVVNNAGIRDSGSLLNMKYAAIRRVFEVNTFSVVSILKEVVSKHLEQDSKRRLSIVNVSSVLGTFGPKNLLVYSASKAASIQIHECFAEEVKQFPTIRPLLVIPGQLTTDMFSDVTPSRQFFAPLVDHRQLARVVVGKLVDGETGVLCEPLYANFLPIMKVLPLSIQRLARWASEMDDKVKE